MNKQPLVSIIIPSFNRAHLIGETLDSVLAQTYTHWECVVVDDGSTDNTEALIKTYTEKDKRFKYYVRPESHLPGGSGARNFGLIRSKGKFVQYFDSDDIMHADYLEDRLAVFAENPNTDVVFCAFTYFTENGLEDRVTNAEFSGTIMTDRIHRGFSFSTLPFLLRKELAQKFQFNETLKQAQDSDYFFRMFTSSYPINIRHVPKVLFRVRKHSETISMNMSSDFLRSRFIVNKKFLDYYRKNNSPEGVARYKRDCIKDIKRMVVRKHYKTAFQSFVSPNFLSFGDKTYLLTHRFKDVYIDKVAMRHKSGAL